MSEAIDGSGRLAAAEADVEQFRKALGPFVVAAEKTRMPMIFTHAGVADNRIIFANDAFLDLTGFARDEVLGANFISLMDADGAPGAVEEIETAFAGRAEHEPEACYRRSDGTSFWASLFISPVCDETGAVVQHFISVVDQTRQREKQAHSEMLINELNHRVKNTLSTIQSIVRQAIRASDDPKAVGEAIESRIFALSRSHDLLTRHDWEGAGLHDLIDAAVEPFEAERGGAKRIQVEGLNVRLAPKAALALGIAFHELATNAVKYGALSNDRGTVRIAWKSEITPSGERLVLTWRENDGPVVAAPTRVGFGSQMVERGLTHELRGAVHIDYRPEGLVCTIDFPFEGSIANG